MFSSWQSLIVIPLSVQSSDYQHIQSSQLSALAAAWLSFQFPQERSEVFASQIYLQNWACSLWLLFSWKMNKELFVDCVFLLQPCLSVSIRTHINNLSRQISRYHLHHSAGSNEKNVSGLQHVQLSSILKLSLQLLHFSQAPQLRSPTSCALQNAGVLLKTSSVTANYFHLLFPMPLSV